MAELLGRRRKIVGGESDVGSRQQSVLVEEVRRMIGTRLFHAPEVICDHQFEEAGRTSREKEDISLQNVLAAYSMKARHANRIILKSHTSETIFQKCCRDKAGESQRLHVCLRLSKDQLPLIDTIAPLTRLALRTGTLDFWVLEAQ